MINKYIVFIFLPCQLIASFEEDKEWELNLKKLSPEQLDEEYKEWEDYLKDHPQVTTRQLLKCLEENVDPHPFLEEQTKRYSADEVSELFSILLRKNSSSKNTGDIHRIFEEWSESMFHGHFLRGWKRAPRLNSCIYTNPGPLSAWESLESIEKRLKAIEDLKNPKPLKSIEKEHPFNGKDLEVSVWIPYDPEREDENNDPLNESFEIERRDS